MADRLLIVDDDVDTLRLVGLMLERQGYEIIAASNGEQALRVAKSEIPDLIILDVMMPDMDGYEVARQLRADPSTADIPIIMFTAKSQTEDRVTGIESGADVYLTKPTQPRELFAHIKAMLTRRKKVSTPQVTKEPPKGKIIGVMGTRGGMGISTVAINLGVTIKMTTKEDTIVAEYRPGFGGISLDLGYPNPEGLNRLLQKKAGNITTKEVDAELVTHESGVRLLLASPRPKDGLYLQEGATFKAITKELKYLAKYSILDLGGSLNPIAYNVVPECDVIMIILEPTPLNVRQTHALIEDLYNHGIGEGHLVYVLVNRVRSNLQLGWVQVQDELGKKINAVITPAPELAYQSSVNNIPMVLNQPESITADQFRKLAENLTTMLG